ADPIRWYAPMIAQDAHARPGPAVALAGLLASPVEHGCDRLIPHLPRQHGDEFDHIRMGTPPVLTRAVLAHPQGRMVAASPADHKAQRLVLHADTDLLDQRAGAPPAR